MRDRWATVETVTDFIFWGLKMTADGDFSHKIKRCLLLKREVMTNLDSIFKSSRVYIGVVSYCIVALAEERKKPK